MKKIIAFTMLLLTFAGSAFAAALATHTPTPSAGLSVFGGVDGTAAGAATSPLIKFSTGVRGLVNFTSNSAYAIATKHDTGSKVFGTASDSTAIYWKQDPAAALVAGDIGSETTTSALFVGGGWTAY